MTYWGADGITNTGSSPITPSRSTHEAGQNITLSVVVNDELVLNEVKVTDDNGMIVLIVSAGENYFLSIHHDADSYYTKAEKVISNMTFKVNVDSQTTHNMTVNITAKSNIFREFMEAELVFIFPNGENVSANYAGNGTWWTLHTFDDYGNYSVNATCIGPDNVTVTNATISVSKTPTEIRVENESVDLFVGDCVGAGATLTPADAGNLTFTSSNVSVVKVEDGKLIAVGEGTAVITVAFAGSEDYLAAENKTISVAVSKVPTEISVDSYSLELLVDDETDIFAVLAPVDAGNVTFTSSNDSVVSVDAHGHVIAWAKGQAVITVSFAGDNKYAAAENRTITVDVGLNPANVTVDKDTLDLKVGETYAINATKNPKTILLDIYYYSSNNSVAIVDEKGIVTAVGEGRAIITVEVGDDERYAKNSTNITVSVSKIPTEIAASDISTVYNIDKYLIVNLKDTNGKPLSGVNVTVDLNGAKTYTTDSNGQVKVSTKGLSAKTYTARITFNGNTSHAKSTKDVKVTVKKAANPLKVKGKKVKVKFSKLKKKAKKLKVKKVVKFTKKGQGKLTYKKVKGNKKIKINKKTGKVTIKKGLKKGTYKVKMKIRAKGNANYKASGYKKLTFKINVK